MSYTLRTARPADIPAVLDLLQQLADWLHARGYDQWTGQWSREVIEDAINRGHVWLLETRDDPSPIGTVTLSNQGDPDFWTASERAEPALYLSKLAIRRDHAGHELGNILLSWARDYAARCGAGLVRFDAWRTNTDLHGYYLRRGWKHVRTVDRPGRRSGALFELPAQQLDLESKAQLHEQPAHSHHARNG